MTKVVLLLGANGFIGEHLHSHLNEHYEVITLNRSLNDMESVLQRNRPDIIINCGASAPDANFMDSLEANLLYPLKCLKVVLEEKSPTVKWVQISSYFELQIEFGRRDNYSIHKATCGALFKRANEEGVIDLTTIYLPHVFGPGERTSRIIPTLTTTLASGDEVTITSGEQLLPILSVEDACHAIEMAIETDQIECSALPIWYGKVAELASSIHKKIRKGNVILNPSRVSIDATFPKVNFPPGVKNWTPKHDFDDFLSLMEDSK